jgi:hypothetical protein
LGGTHEPEEAGDVPAGAVDAVLLLLVPDVLGEEGVVDWPADVVLEASNAPVEPVEAAPPPPPPQPARLRAATTGSRPVRTTLCRYFMIGRSDETDGGNKRCLPVGQSGRCICSMRSHDANTAPATPLS